MKKTTILIIALLVCASLNAQNFDVKNLEKAKSIIQKANDVALATKTVSYNYTYKGDGKYNGHFRGAVKLKGTFPKFFSHITLGFLDEKQRLLKTEEIAIATMNIEAIDHESKEYKYGSMTGGSNHLSSYSYYATLFQYLSPEPFKTELNDPTLKYEGQKTVNGVQCNVVSTSNAFKDRIYYYTGVEDHMIHAQKSVNDDPLEGGGFYFEVSALAVDQPISENDLKIDVPANYTRIDEDNREIKVGIDAPGWFLKNLDGKSRRTLDYKGQVVVLDFWASWCKPCWTIMPVINDIQEAYDEKEVKVFGVNVWEKKGLDVKAYLDEKGLVHYETLIDKDARTAKKYKILALPLVVVIGKDGKIKYMTGQGTKDLEKELKAAVKAALEQ